MRGRRVELRNSKSKKRRLRFAGLGLTTKLRPSDLPERWCAKGAGMNIDAWVRIHRGPLMFLTIAVVALVVILKNADTSASGT